MIEEMWGYHLQGNMPVYVCVWYFVLIAYKFLLYVTSDVHRIWFSCSREQQTWRIVGISTKTSPMMNIEVMNV